MAGKKRQERELPLMVASYLKAHGLKDTLTSFLSEMDSGITGADIGKGGLVDLEEVYSFWKTANDGGKKKGTKRKAETVEDPPVEPSKASKRGKDKLDAVDSGLTANADDKSKSKNENEATEKVAKRKKAKDVEQQVQAEVLLANSESIDGEVNESAKGGKAKKPRSKKAKDVVAPEENGDGDQNGVTGEPLGSATNNQAELPNTKAGKAAKKLNVSTEAKKSENGTENGKEDGRESIEAGQEREGTQRKKGKKKAAENKETTASAEELPSIANSETNNVEESAKGPVQGLRKSKRGKKEVPSAQPQEDTTELPESAVKPPENIPTSPTDARKSPKDVSKSPATGAISAEGKGTAARAFQRVRVEEVEFMDERLKDNSYWAKKGAETGWGAKAQEVLGQVRGKGFRHEKTKKKRGSYKGGAIDMDSHSIKFKDSDEEE